MHCSKSYGLARQLVLDDLIDVDHGERVNTLSVLTYLYYAGIVCIGLKLYKRSIHFFSMVLCVPQDTPSHVSVEAYKRLVLVCLIVYGKVQPHPHHNHVPPRDGHALV